MNAMRGLALAMVVGLLAVGVRAEEKKKAAKTDYAKMLIGKWEVTKADEGTVPPNAQIEFTKDGKLIVGSDDMKHEGTYKVEGAAFIITFGEGDGKHVDTITIKKITDTEMSTSNKEGKVVELKRKK